MNYKYHYSHKNGIKNYKQIINKRDVYIYKVHCATREGLCYIVLKAQIMTFMKKVLFVFTALVLLSSVLLTGCSLLQVSPTTTVGDVLKLYGIDPITLDPAVAGDGNSHDYIVQIFSGLVRLDDNLEPAADIAERWELSQDRRTYTFYLKKNVSFHDGRGVTAADFKYSWERACNPATGSSTAGTYLGDIVGVNDVVAGKAKEISGVKVVSDYVLQVTIDAPRSYFLFRLTYPTAFVVDKANVAAGGEWWRKPNGTGPFKLKEWQANSLIVLERNDSYYGDVAGVTQVQYALWSGVPMNLYETGDIDTAGVSVDYIDRVNDKAGPFYDQLQISAEMSFYWIGFNLTKPPFDDINVRKAFTLAVDKDKLISLSFRNLVQRADGILPPGIPGYNDKLTGLGYDVSKAKELIAKSKYGSAANLPPITLTTSGYGGQISSYLEAIINDWRQNLGVEVTVRQLEPDRFIYNLKEEKDELFDMGWIADYPHPQDFLDVLFRTGAENNYGEYSNPAVDALLDKAALEADSAKSLALYQQAEQMLVDDAAMLPLWFGESYTLVKPYVTGYKLNAMGFAWLNKVSIKPH
jgi:oligopeptide transport system substrate-binding protein